MASKKMSSSRMATQKGRCGMGEFINYPAIYYEEKTQFLNNIIDNLMERFDPGGTLPVFPDFDEWLERKSNRPKQ